MKTVIVVDSVNKDGKATSVTVYGDVAPEELFKRCKTLTNITIRAGCSPLQELEALKAEYRELAVEYAMVLSSRNRIAFKYEELRNGLKELANKYK